MPTGHYKRTPEMITKAVAARAAARPSLLVRFWSKVKVGTADECWTWSGTIVQGYGWFHLSGDYRRGDLKRMAAHRFSWELHNKVEIPAGLVIDHACKRLDCVNPAHLRVVTQEANCMELARPNPFLNNRQKTKCIRGHDFDLIVTTREGKTVRACSACRRFWSQQARDRKEAA